MNKLDLRILSFGPRNTYYFSAIIMAVGTIAAATFVAVGVLGILGSQGIVIPIRYFSDAVNAKLLNGCILTASGPVILIPSVLPFAIVVYRLKKIAQALGVPPPPLAIMPPAPMTPP